MVSDLLAADPKLGMVLGSVVGPALRNLPPEQMLAVRDKLYAICEEFRMIDGLGTLPIGVE
jgi:hypothetical protein